MSTHATTANGVARVYRNLPVKSRWGETALQIWVREQVNDSIKHGATDIRFSFRPDGENYLEHVYTENGDGDADFNRLRAGASPESVDPISVYGVGKPLAESKLCEEGYQSEIQVKKRGSGVVNRLVGPPKKDGFWEQKESLDYDSPDVLVPVKKEDGMWTHKIRIPADRLPSVHFSNKLDTESMKVSDLKKKLEEKGVVVGKKDKKPELVQKFKDYIAANPEPEEAYPPADVCRNLLNQIKEILRVVYPQHVFQKISFTIEAVGGMMGVVHRIKSTPSEPWKCLTYTLEMKPDNVVKKWPRDILTMDGCVATTARYKILVKDDSDLNEFPNHTVNGAALYLINGFVNHDAELHTAFIGKKSHASTYNNQLAITNFTLSPGNADCSKLPRPNSVKVQIDERDPVLLKHRKHFTETNPSDFAVYISPADRAPAAAAPPPPVVLPDNNRQEGAMFPVNFLPPEFMNITSIDLAIGVGECLGDTFELTSSLTRSGEDKFVFHVPRLARPYKVVPALITGLTVWCKSRNKNIARAVIEWRALHSQKSTLESCIDVLKTTMPVLDNVNIVDV